MPAGRASSKRDLEISIAFETFADSWCASTSGATDWTGLSAGRDGLILMERPGCVKRWAG